MRRMGHLLVTITLLAGAAAPAFADQMIAAAAQERQERLDINRASEEELQRVPGIGPAMARRIVEWREEHGRFERIDDLLNVRGIGVKTLEKLRPHLRIVAAKDRS